MSILTPRSPRVAKPHRPKAAPTQPSSWIIETGGTGGGGGGGQGVPAPPVTINGPAEIFFRGNHQVEIDVEWTAAANATPQNFSGVFVFLEDPDISSGANEELGDPADTSSGLPLDASAQVSGDWSPVFVNTSIEDSGKTSGTAVLFLDSTMGSVSGQTYKAPRTVRIYLAAYGPFSQPQLVRATEPNPTPNILVSVPLGRGQGESGEEWAFLARNVRVEVGTDYNRPDPKYYLTFYYDPPDPAIPVPPGLNPFGGCRIIYVYEDAAGNPVFPGTNTGIDVPVAQAEDGYKSSLYDPGSGGGQFRCYFCSEDDSHPLGMHINSLIEGVTPYAEAVVPPVPGTPDVTGLAIQNQRFDWLLDGSFIAHADLSWHLPSTDAGLIRYAGVYLYLVKVTGSFTPLTTFPKILPHTGLLSNKATSFPLNIDEIPKNPEVWTIAAISVSALGALADDPAKFGQSGFHSPTCTWNIGPPAAGSPGSGLEYAPLVTIAPGATVVPAESLSSDGVQMVSFSVGPWQNPDDNQFGNPQLAMIVDHGDPKSALFWSLPGNATSFVTPKMPAFGRTGGPAVNVDFYIVSDDPQGNKNSLIPGTTPVIHATYTPSAGQIIPARSGWFDPSQFAWNDAAGGFQAETFSAKVVQVGKTLVVGGAPSTFGGSDNGQIAVKNSSGVLRGWIGEQQPGQGDSSPLWGAWFGQIWIGGTNPLDAPLWIDNYGVIQVGGIAAAKGSTYPYMSIRDDTGLEKGRIGAKINAPSGLPGDATGPTPPAQLTSGAWFTQLAVGGNSLSNWNVLVVPDPNNALGSQFQMRNINLFQIDYAAHAAGATPLNQAYRLLLGNSVWVAGGSQWQFPGIRIFEIDNVGNNFGAVFVNRGMVLTGHQQQGYPVLASLVTYNGQSTGSDYPYVFWSELAMYSPVSPFVRTIYLASGNASADGFVSGTPTFALYDRNNAVMFRVDPFGNNVFTGTIAGNGGGAVNLYALNINGIAVINTAGQWVGPAISSGQPQTPWAQNIAANGFGLFGAGTVQATQFQVGGTVVVNSSGQFVGAGINVGGQGIQCGSLNTAGAAGGGQIDTAKINISGLLNSSGEIVTSGQLHTTNTASDALKSSGGVTAANYYVSTGPTTASAVINASLQFVGNGVLCPTYGCGCSGYNVWDAAKGWLYGIDALTPPLGSNGYRLGFSKGVLTYYGP